MSTPAVLRWPLPDWVIAEAGIACPACGTRARLILAMDLDDRSDEPSYMACPAGHQWAEKRLPRRVGAELLAEVLDAEPGLLGSLDELRREYGGE
ncbi:hypothetical protein AB0N17_03615 [Streptomyces sp. NPDC051133]|uniref:hypothetical protein n=1 Tax=Streptomyces sp. NPDC051133 TaxID=3155521 RepID=UPI00343AF078